jgi:hypothetical protein
MKNWFLVLMVLVLVLVLGMDAEARGRRGGRSCGPNGCNFQAAPATVHYEANAVFGPNDEVVTVEAKPVVKATVAEQFVAKHSEQTNRDAQGVANMMAARNYVGHFGGNPGYEGCGMASTRDGAYRICCYANSGMRDADVGFAKGRNGMWFCCRRYR